MWRMYNVVQLQPRFFRNLGSNSSSPFPSPMIIDSSKSSTTRKHGTSKSPLKSSIENLADRVSKLHSAYNGDSKKLVSRFKEFVRNRFYNCNEASTETGHFSEMSDKSFGNSPITKDNMSSYTKASLNPVKKFELYPNFSQGSDISESGCDSYGTISAKEQVGKETLKLNVAHFMNSRDEPPSKKLEEILKSLREWETKIGWCAQNPECVGTLVSKKQDLDNIVSYAIEMQKKNNIRNQRRNLAVEVKFGLADNQKKKSTIKKCSYPTKKLSGDELMKAIKADQLMKSSILTKKGYSVDKSSHLNEFIVPSSKSKHDEGLKIMEPNKKITIKINESCHKKINKLRTNSEENHDQQSGIESISSEVKEIDSIVNHCKNLKRIYKKRLNYKRPLQKLNEKCNRKNNRELKYALKKRSMNENKYLKTTTNEVCVDKKPQLRISVAKLKTLNKRKTASMETTQNEVKRMLVELKRLSELKQKESDDFEISRKNLSLSEIKYAISESKNKFKDLSMNSKARNFGTKVNIKKDEFLRKCQAERNRKNCKGSGSKKESINKEARKSVPKSLEAKENEFVKNDSKDSNIYRTDDGRSKNISTASPSSVLYKNFEPDALLQVFKDSFENRRSCSELYLPSEVEESNSEAQFNSNWEVKNKLWTLQWMQKFAQTPLHLRTDSNILYHLPHFKGGYFIGNTQLSMKLLDLMEDQMLGYDESES